MTLTGGMTSIPKMTLGIASIMLDLGVFGTGVRQFELGYHVVPPGDTVRIGSGRCAGNRNRACMIPWVNSSNPQRHTVRDRQPGGVSPSVLREKGRQSAVSEDPHLHIAICAVHQHKDPAG